MRTLTYTAVCQSGDNNLTPWIEVVTIASGTDAVERAIAEARTRCAMARGVSRDQVACLGLTPGHHGATAKWDYQVAPERQS